MCVRECSQFVAELTAKGIWCRRLSHISLLLLLSLCLCTKTIFVFGVSHANATPTCCVSHGERVNDSMKMMNETQMWSNKSRTCFEPAAIYCHFQCWFYCSATVVVICILCAILRFSVPLFFLLSWFNLIKKFISAYKTMTRFIILLRSFGEA